MVTLMIKANVLVYQDSSLDQMEYVNKVEFVDKTKY